MVFIPALLRRDINDLERDLISLPARMGGMGICKPTEQCTTSHSNSNYVCAPLVRLVQRQELEFNPAELYVEVRKLRGDVDNQNEARSKARLDVVLENALPNMKLALKAATEKELQAG